MKIWWRLGLDCWTETIFSGKNIYQLPSRRLYFHRIRTRSVVEMMVTRPHIVVPIFWLNALWSTLKMKILLSASRGRVRVHEMTTYLSNLYFLLIMLRNLLQLLELILPCWLSLKTERTIYSIILLTFDEFVEGYEIKTLLLIS